MPAHRNLDGRSSTEADLARLLARLGPDEERAGREYERLRRTLIKFFDWRGASPADECADETLDRLARKLDGTAVEDVAGYAHGIARMVLLEWRRRPVLGPIDEALLAPASEAASADGTDGLHACFERCLAELPEESRVLILGYYQGERAAKIANRQRMAAALTLSESALRSRVQRVRDRLERCVRECTARTTR
jgi:DNA-directed RNA polymerase specialized sigma24 family protein